MAFSTHDQVPDSPTNVFATLNSIFPSSGTYTNGNLYISADNSDYHFSTISVPVGKIIYFEIIPLSTTNREIVGFKTVGNNYTNGDYDIYYYNWQDDDTRRISENGSYISSHLNNDITGKIVGLALDLTGTYINLKMYVNGSLLVNQNTTTTVNSRNNIFPYVRSASGAFTFYLNFGQDSSFGGNRTSGSANAQDANGIGDFYYDPPTVSGTKALALCTANLPDPAIDPAVDDLPEDHFKCLTYQGAGSSTKTINLGFNPDLLWFKQRTDSGTPHRIMDTVRGLDNYLASSSSDQQYSYDYLDLNTSTNDITLKASTGVAVNAASKNYIAWCWKAGGAPTADYASGNDTTANGCFYKDGSAVTTSNAFSGSYTITPTRASIGTKQGTSFIKFQGNNTAGATIPHGLSAVPDFIMVKNLSNNDRHWTIYHKSLTYTHYIDLDQVNVAGNDSSVWYAAPTQSVFSFGANPRGNENNADHIAYCFTSIEGYSAFGSYTGNGSTDGPFIYTGFRPAWLLIKNIDTAGDWWIYDTTRDDYNVAEKVLYPNLSDSEYVGASVFGRDFLSNGFKVRNNNFGVNGSGDRYIYTTFAEMPFKYANAR